MKLGTNYCFIIIVFILLAVHRKDGALPYKVVKNVFLHIFLVVAGGYTGRVKMGTG